MGVDLDLESISGAVGSLLNTTILYPLDTCKSKFKAEIRVRGQLKYRYGALQKIQKPWSSLLRKVGLHKSTMK